MRRVETYVGSQVYEWVDSAQAQNTMTAIAKVCAALFGTNGVVNGLAVAPTSPATMTVQIGAGEVYQMEYLEATACGTLPANTAYNILKQGIQFGNYTTTTFATPSSAGQSINYLIQAQYQDSDISLDPTTGNTPVVLQFYNSTNPATPWSGPNNSGATSNTFRDGIVAYNILAGVAATTGSQVTPTPSTGWVPIAVVTVPYGASSLTASNISVYPGASVLPTQGIMAALQSDLLNYAVDTGTANTYVVTFSPAIPSIVDGTKLRFRALHANTGASTLNPNGLGAAAIFSAQHVALVSGEIVVGGDVEVVWNSTLNTTGAWVLLECTGGAQQLPSGSYGVTPSLFDNTTKLVTSAFVQRALGNYAGELLINSATTLTNANVGQWVTSNASSTINIALPASSTCPAGSAILITNNGSAVATVIRQGTDTINVTSSMTSVALGAGDSGLFVSTGTGVWALVAGSAQAQYSPNASVGCPAQSWTNVIGSRSTGTTYTNSTGRPIMVAASITSTQGCSVVATVNGLTIYGSAGSTGAVMGICFIVNPGGTYSITSQAGTPTLQNWDELR